MSVATKVTIQVAAKLGAQPWSVRVPQTVDLTLIQFCSSINTL